MKVSGTKRGMSMWNKPEWMKAKHWKTGIVTGVAAILAIGSILCTGNVAQAESAEKQIQILFTHDMHSYLETKETDNCAAIKSYIEEAKKACEQTFVLDGGDFSMGTLYQTIYEESAVELTMLGRMGYDATTIGNHEFDYRPQGFAGMLKAAVANQKEDPALQLPALLCANIDWDKNTSQDNLLVKEAMDEYGAKAYTIVEHGGVRAGIFGLMGVDSAYCAPLSGLIFEDAVETAKQVVQELQEQDVDIIICLSHSGICDNLEKSEDEQLALAVPEIDVIISGHSHSKVEKPIVHGDTYVVCAGSYAENLGQLCLTQKGDGCWKLDSYALNKVSEMTGKDEELVQVLADYKEVADEQYFSRFGYRADQVLTENTITFHDIDTIWSMRGEDEEGELISDSYIRKVKEVEKDYYIPVAAAVTPSGVIRTTIPQGTVTVADAFEVMSLGIGADGVPGYPLVSFYVTGKELHNAAEIDASLSPYVTGVELYASGWGWAYNKHRILLNKVTDVWLEQEDGTAEPIRKDDQLYRVVTDLYTCQMIGAVKAQLLGLLSVEPKDAEGNVVTDYDTLILHDAKGNEVKAWVALADYLASFGTDGQIPAEYETPFGRKIISDSYNVWELIKAPNKTTGMFLGVIVVLLALVAGIIAGICAVVKKAKRKKNKQ